MRVNIYGEEAKVQPIPDMDTCPYRLHQSKWTNQKREFPYRGARIGRDWFPLSLYIPPFLPLCHVHIQFFNRGDTGSFLLFSFLSVHPRWWIVCNPLIPLDINILIIYVAFEHSSQFPIRKHDRCPSPYSIDYLPSKRRDRRKEKPSS